MGARHTRSPPQERPQTSHRQAADQASEPLTGERYPRPLRLARERELMACWTAGRRWRGSALDLAWLANQVGHPRAGIIVPRHRHNAVARNRLRRRLREIVRRDLVPALSAVDLVVRAKPLAYGVPFAMLRAELLRGAGTIA